MVIAAAQRHSGGPTRLLSSRGQAGHGAFVGKSPQARVLEPDSPARVCSCRYEQVRPLLSVAVLFNYSDRAAKEALGLWCERLS